MKLSEIKAHPSFPFADFRSSDASFLLLELFWSALAQETLGDDFSKKCVPLQEAEQDKDNDGTPLMLDFWVPEQKRGMRVLLNENEGELPLYSQTKNEDLVYFPIYPSASIRTRPEPHAFETDGKIDDAIYKIEELFFIADCSDESIQWIQKGMQSFFIEGVSLEEMLATCKDYEKHVGMPQD